MRLKWNAIYCSLLRRVDKFNKLIRWHSDHFSVFLGEDLMWFFSEQLDENCTSLRCPTMAEVCLTIYMTATTKRWQSTAVDSKQNNCVILFSQLSMTSSRRLFTITIGPSSAEINLDKDADLENENRKLIISRRSMILYSLKGSLGNPDCYLSAIVSIKL
jgi:hypothetical protein